MAFLYQHTTGFEPGLFSNAAKYFCCFHFFHQYTLPNLSCLSNWICSRDCDIQPCKIISVKVSLMNAIKLRLPGFKAGTSRHSSYKPPSYGRVKTLLRLHSSLNDWRFVTDTIRAPSRIHNSQTMRCEITESQNDAVNSDCYNFLNIEVLTCNLLKSFFTPCLKVLCPKAAGGLWYLQYNDVVRTILSHIHCKNLYYAVHGNLILMNTGGVAQLSNLWWIPNSVSKGFDTAMKTGSSRRFKRYPTTYNWVSSRPPCLYCGLG